MAILPLDVKDWIDSIDAGTFPDALTTLETKVDSQIGGLKATLENVVGMTRAVPLFEVRNLAPVNSGAMESTVTNAEAAVIALHQKHANAARKRDDPSLSHIKRDLCPTRVAPGKPTLSCTMQNEDPDASIDTLGCICGSTTLPPITVANPTDDSQSCAYTTLSPKGDKTDPIVIPNSTYATNC